MKQLKLSLSIAIILMVHQGFGQSNPIEIPMQEKHWEFSEGKVEFMTHKSVPAIKILSDAGKVIPMDVEFSTGTIEFDVVLGDFPFVGFSFHRHGPGEEEWFYFRPYAAGNPTAMDAIQYAPIVKGVTLWDMYPQYQGPANFQKGEWTHVKLVVAKQQMHVYVNETEKPTLAIPNLEGNYPTGAISFDGEAIFANLTIQAGVVQGLPEIAGYDPSSSDPRYIRKWSLTTPIAFPRGREVIETDVPRSNSNWSTLQAEGTGLVNLSREFGSANDGSRRLVWLKSSISSEKAQSRNLSLGFSDEVWVLINGQLLYVDKNYYRQAIMKNPKGRCSLENTTFEVPLAEGENELLIGVGNDFYGWGIIARWDKLDHMVLE